MNAARRGTGTLSERISLGRRYLKHFHHFEVALLQLGAPTSWGWVVVIACKWRRTVKRVNAPTSAADSRARAAVQRGVKNSRLFPDDGVQRACVGADRRHVIEEAAPKRWVASEP